MTILHTLQIYSEKKFVGKFQISMTYILDILCHYWLQDGDSLYKAASFYVNSPNVLSTLLDSDEKDSVRLSLLTIAFFGFMVIDSI